MTLPKNILVATEFSAAAEAALDYALCLAVALGDKVHVVHAYQLPLGLVAFPPSAPLPSPDIAARIVSSAEQELAACMAKRKGTKVEVVPILKHADPREAVLAVARDVAADLVIMGTHGRQGIARALIGSVAEAVVRASPIPVMTVHGRT
jgi:nucleotide-binding universal stress UspA family protein